MPKNKHSFETNDKEVRILISIVISLDLINFIVNIRKKNPQIYFKIASDSIAGATMSLNDVHGNILKAIVESFDNAR